MRWGLSIYKPVPKPCAVRGILFQKWSVEVGFVDDVETVELVADIRPVTITPDSIIGHGYRCREVLMRWRRCERWDKGNCGHANKVVLTDRSLTHLLERQSGLIC